MSTTSMGRWKLIRDFPGELRFFTLDADPLFCNDGTYNGRIWIADRSGETPEQTDDGPSYVDSRRPILTRKGRELADGTTAFYLPVLDMYDEECVVPASGEVASWISTKLGMSYKPSHAETSLEILAGCGRLPETCPPLLVWDMRALFPLPFHADYDQDSYRWTLIDPGLHGGYDFEKLRSVTPEECTVEAKLDDVLAGVLMLQRMQLKEGFVGQSTGQAERAMREAQEALADLAGMMSDPGCVADDGDPRHYRMTLARVVSSLGWLDENGFTILKPNRK